VKKWLTLNCLDLVSMCNYNITMKNITVRNIPLAIFEKLRLLSELDRRSLNNELMVALETGVRELEPKSTRLAAGMSPKVQTDLPLLKWFGALKARLKKNNRLLPDADIFVAAAALEKAEALATCNVRHCERIEGLKIENWSV